MNQNDALDPKLLTHLASLRATPFRNPQRAARARAAFLAQAEALRPPAQQKNFLAWFRLAPAQKLGLAILLLAGLLLGSGALTVTAAQASLPNQALYPVKTWSEDLRLEMAASPDSALALEMEFTRRRVDEIQQMLQAGTTPPENVVTRLDDQAQAALEAAANLPDVQAKTALLEIGSQLQAHESTLSQLPSQSASPAAQELCNRAQAVLAQNYRLAQTGAAEPAWLREQTRARRGQDGPWLFPTDTPLPTITGLPTNTAVPPAGTATPIGNGFGPGGPQDPARTGTPGTDDPKGFGPGPGEPRNTPAHGTTTPGSGSGGNGGSSNSNGDSSNSEGSGNGSGDGSGNGNGGGPGDGTGTGSGSGH